MPSYMVRDIDGHSGASAYRLLTQPVLGFTQVAKMSCDVNGAARGTRTPDPVITNDVLYQLSYCGGPWRTQGSPASRP